MHEQVQLQLAACVEKFWKERSSFMGYKKPVVELEKFCI